MNEFIFFNEVLSKFTIAYDYYCSILAFDFNYTKYPNLNLNFEEENKKLSDLGFCTDENSLYISLVGKHRLNDYKVLASGNTDSYLKESPYNLISLYANFFNTEKSNELVVNKNYLFEFINFKNNIENKFKLDPIDVLLDIQLNIDLITEKLEEDYIALTFAEVVYDSYKEVIYANLPETYFNKVKKILLSHNLHLGDILFEYDYACGYAINLKHGFIYKESQSPYYDYHLSKKYNTKCDKNILNTKDMNKFLDVISETVNGYNAINEEFIIAKDILKVLNNK